MTVPKQDWLEQVVEEPLDPELPICDPHHHLWGHPENRYLLDDLLADIGGHNVVSTVFVECMSEYKKSEPEALQPVGETEFVESIAIDSLSRKGNDTAQVCAGIVSYANLLLGEEVANVLAAHQQASPTRLRGIRHACGWDPSPEIRNSHTNPPGGLYLIPRFREGLRCLEKLGLTFDAWLYFTQIPELTALARAVPGVTIIMDHVGGPLGIGPYAGKRDEVFQQWKKAVTELAECPNVVVKLGGLQMPICGFRWHKRKAPPTSKELATATKPFYDHCIEAFGVQRCMFESNFPVDKASCSYTVLWNAFKRFAAEFTVNEKALLFHDNAARVYRID